MFSICTAFIENGKLDEAILDISSTEEKFTIEIGVKFRQFFQCKIQPHIIWSLTEWISEKAHNDAAQSIMKSRRDDRIASIAFGPEPYFEIFCEEDEEILIGDFTKDLKHIIVAHGLINKNNRDTYLNLRKNRFEEYKKKIHWIRSFHNKYNDNDFVAVLGFINEGEYIEFPKIEQMHIEEYLLTGLRNLLGMSYLASYNQFICEPLILKK